MKKLLVLTLALLMTMSLFACGEPEQPSNTDASTQTEAKEEAKKLDMRTVYADMGKVINQDDFFVVPEEMLLDHCGIDPADTEQILVVLCNDSLKTDEIWLIEAKDESAVEGMIEKINERLKKKGEESISYSPEQYAVVQKAQVLHKGCYIAMLVSPDVDELAQVFREEAGM